jgi:hypothetical protein
MRRRAIIIIGLLVVTGLLAFIFRDQLGGISGWQWAGLAMGLMSLAIVGGGNDLGPHWFRNAMIWVVIIFGIAVAYSFAAPYLPEDFGQRGWRS